MKQYKYTLDELLEIYTVLEPGMWENALTGTIMDKWYSVCNDDGIIAYFYNANDAYAFRLNKINTILNGEKG